MTTTFNRRHFLEQAGVAGLSVMGLNGAEARAIKPKRIAAIITHYTHNSHADVIVSRLLQGYNLDFKALRPNMELVGLYCDQFPANDMSRKLAQEHQFPIFGSIGEALRLGGKDLAVDGVILIGEHGNYPVTEMGQIMYPRRQLFEETAKVFRQSGCSVPVFSDKHLAWNWPDAKWMVDTARELKIPFMAGSSIPRTWRYPALEMRPGADAKEAICLSFGHLEAYGYHGLEAMQSIVEHRKGGETGVKAVQYVEGDAVFDKELFDRRLFDTVVDARRAKGKRSAEEFRKAFKPAAFVIEYRDGFRATLLHDMGSANTEWVTGWSETADGEGDTSYFATAHYTQEARPFGHFALLVQDIERMMFSGKPTRPVERTLLVTGILATAFQSKQQAGTRIETPYLEFSYRPGPSWRQPPLPPPDRPMNGQ